MQFEWDEAKAASNLKKHGVPFVYATEAFFDSQRVDIEDARHEYGEERRHTFGRSEGRVIAVAYTLRGETIRLIPARKANRKGVRNYDHHSL